MKCKDFSVSNSFLAGVDNTVTSDNRIAVHEYVPSTYNDFTGVALPYIKSQSVCDAMDHISVEVEVGCISRTLSVYAIFILMCHLFVYFIYISP